MSQSLSKLFVHLIFHVKSDTCFIRQEDENELYVYIGGLIKLSKSIPININGTRDHLHVLCIMSKNVSLADLLEDIKRNSSRWIKTKNIHYRKFFLAGWLRGVFSQSIKSGSCEPIYCESEGTS